MRFLFSLLLKLTILLLVVAGLALGYVYWATNARINRTYTIVVPPVTVPNDAAAIERGRYLVRQVSMCTECHGEDLGGKAFIDSAIMARLYGPNLTAGRGGIGATYTDADWARTLLHGVKRDGRSVLFMPSQDYHFTQEDFAAIVAYIRSVPPVDRETPPPSIGPMARILTMTGAFPLLPAEAIDHGSVRFAEATTIDTPEAAGHHLVSAAGCRGCHGQDLSGAGGMPNAANLTPVGLGDWTEQDFIAALREGRRPNGTEIAPEMPRAFGKMSDEDLHRIFLYLKSLPPQGEKSEAQRREAD